MIECEYETMPGFCGVTMCMCDPDCVPAMSDETCGERISRFARKCPECSVPALRSDEEKGGDA